MHDNKTTPVEQHPVDDIWARDSFLVVLHFYATGPGQELHDWLAHDGKADATLLEHPFPFSKRSGALWQHWCKDALVRKRLYRRRSLPLPLRYALDFLRTIRLVLFSGQRYDWYVGNGSFDTLPGIVLRWLGRVRHVVLYTIDYAPGAGGRGWYALLYRHIDRFCCYHANVIWNLSARMHEARIADGLDVGRCAPALVVPHGAHAAAMRPLLPRDADPCRLAFMGHVQAKSGIQIVLRALPVLARTMPSVHLDILGDGPYVPELKALAASLGVASRTTFHGYVDDHEELERRIARCGIGIALYADDPNDFSRLADPGKLKVYLACGLPIVLTNVPAVAREIETRGAGVVVDADEQSLANAVAAIAARHSEFRTAALAMARDYEWATVFKRALAESARALRSVQI